MLSAALKTSQALLKVQRKDGSLPGRLNADWKPEASWSCLTGNVQIADSWFYLGNLTNNDLMINAAKKANRFVRLTIQQDGPIGIRGGVKGAHPIQGDYGSFEYLNWAAKFAIDSNLSELM